jgi:hypothetical protein
VPIPRPRADIQEEPRHHFHVADPRDVGENAFFVGQQTRREQRQRGVLVAFDGDASFEAVSTFNQ